MYQVLIVIHALVTLALVIIILMQRSSTDGMGLSGSSSTSFMSGRAAASFITRATSVLAALFILLSLGIGVLTAHSHTANSGSIMDKIVNTPASKDTPKTSLPTEKPAQPEVPRPE